MLRRKEQIPVEHGGPRAVRAGTQTIHGGCASSVGQKALSYYTSLFMLLLTLLEKL